MNILIVYETKFGNTKKVAELIAEGIKQVENVTPKVINVNEVEYGKIQDYHALIIGSPTWGGNFTPSIKEFINKTADLSLEGKFYATFDTNNNLPLLSNVVKKLEKKVSKKMPTFKRILAGLPVRVIGLQGPINDDEIPKCQTFGKEIALNLKK